MSFLKNLPEIRGKYRENVNIGKLCWFKTDAIAKVVFIPADLEDLQYFLLKKPKNLPIFVIGAGSNLLVRKNGFNGVIIRLGQNFSHIKLSGNKIIVGSSCLDRTLAKFAANNGIAGLEFYTSIPGTIGGALRMNAGAHGVETKNILVEARAINKNTGILNTFSNQDFGFSYRNNEISDDWIFLEATFSGKNEDKKIILDRMEKIQSLRQQTQPIHSKTGGSTFKNPPEHKAWQLIDKCDLRGYSFGGAKFSELHCNFIVNHNNATGDDIEFLINHAKEKVKRNFNINIETELKIIG